MRIRRDASGRFRPALPAQPSMSDPDFMVRWDKRVNILPHPLRQFVELLLIGAAIFGAAVLAARYGVCLR